MEKQTITAYLEKRSEEFYKLSDKIWDNAEIRFQEKQSSEDMASFLEKEGFKVTRDIAGMKTAFKAEFGSGKPVIGFLGEYDALPDLSQKAGVAVKEPEEKSGNGHGCGHNLLGVGSLIGAVGYKHYLEEEKKTGTVIYFSCPAEEGGSGKTFMAREGCFDDLDCALSWHPAPMTLMAPGTLLANCTVKYSFEGKASHAAGTPEMGRSALDAIELMNVGIQFLREHVPTSVRIHYALTDTGGISPNIVQPHAEGIYQLRAPSRYVLEDVYKRVSDIAKGAALMTGTETKIEFLKATSNTVLNPAIDELMQKNLCEIKNTIGEAKDIDFAKEIVKTQNPAGKADDNVFDYKPKPYNKNGHMAFPGSSDTGDVSWICPLSQFGGVTWPVFTAAHSWQAVACGKSDFAHRGELYAGQVIAATAIDIFNSPEVLEEAWKQFRERTGNSPYKCPIPEKMTPEYLASIID